MSNLSYKGQTPSSTVKSIAKKVCSKARAFIMTDLNEERPADYLLILLADDNIVEQKIARRMFHKMGYEVDVVSNGFEIVQAVRLKSYDVIMLDEQMPALDAFETSIRIRTLPALWKQPWIILSTTDTAVDINRYRKAGIDDAIRKPFDEARLWKMLARVKHVGTRAAQNTGSAL